jgi:hypothetical protein
MASHQSKSQKETVGRVMHEYKRGELRSGTGRKVKNPKQAIAIALSEAGASNQQSPRDNKRNYRRAKAKEARGETAQAEIEGKQSRGSSATGAPTRADLYREAREKGIPGRSKMSRTELERAVGAQ